MSLVISLFVVFLMNRSSSCPVAEFISYLLHVLYFLFKKFFSAEGKIFSFPFTSYQSWHKQVPFCVPLSNRFFACSPLYWDYNPTLCRGLPLESISLPWANLGLCLLFSAPQADLIWPSEQYRGSGNWEDSRLGFWLKDHISLALSMPGNGGLTLCFLVPQNWILGSQ